MSERYDFGGIEDELLRVRMRARGIRFCRFGELPCNMASIYESVKVLCCQSIRANKYYCGRIWLKGGAYWGVSLREKIDRSKALDVCCGKSCSELCFFDGKACGSGIRDHGEDFGNGCVVCLSDRGGFGSFWFCGRIRFENSEVSIDEKIRRQGILSREGGDTQIEC